MATSAVVSFTRQVRQQLPNGSVGLDSDKLRVETTSVPKCNSIVESQFALLKHLRAFKPHASVAHMEATLLWAYNKTGDWLNTLQPEEKEDLFQKARSSAIQFKDRWRQRQVELRRARLACMQAQKTQNADKDKCDSNLNQKTIDAVTDAGGQCRRPEDVDDLCARFKTKKEETEALKQRLNFFKRIVKPTGVKACLYFVTSKGKALPNRQLADNLKSVINQHLPNISEVPIPSSSNATIPNEDVRLRNIVAAKKSILCNYKSQIPPGSAGESRGKKRKEPMPVLEGKRIKRKWILDTTGNAKWCNGTVLAKRTPCDRVSNDDKDCSMVEFDQFDVVYDGEENVHTLCLERDWYRGEIELEESAGDQPADGQAS